MNPRIILNCDPKIFGFQSRRRGAAVLEQEESDEGEQVVVGQIGLMATGCCGVKKQKLQQNASASSTYANNNNGIGSTSTTNGYCNGLSNGYSKSAAGRTPKVANKEMVVFCFDVLYNYLHSADPPKPPKFPNEQL